MTRISRKPVTRQRMYMLGGHLLKRSLERNRTMKRLIAKGITVTLLVAAWPSL